MWALVQRAVAASGFSIEADSVAILDKGQRSVKGLASGFEQIVTADLVLSMRKTSEARASEIRRAPAGYLDLAVQTAIASAKIETPSHVYLAVIRDYLRHGYDLQGIDISHVAATLSAAGYRVDPRSGKLERIASAA